jgi:hypothetical protein
VENVGTTADTFQMTHNLARPVYTALNSALAIESLSSEDRDAVLQLIDELAVAGLYDPVLDIPLGMKACMTRLKPVLTQAQSLLAKYQHIGD